MQRTVGMILCCFDWMQLIQLTAMNSYDDWTPPWIHVLITPQTLCSPLKRPISVPPSHAYAPLANQTPLHDPWLLWTNCSLPCQCDIPTWSPLAFWCCVWSNWDESGFNPSQWAPLSYNFSKSALKVSRDFWSPSRSFVFSVVHLMYWWWV